MVLTLLGCYFLIGIIVAIITGTSLWVEGTKKKWGDMQFSFIILITAFYLVLWLPIGVVYAGIIIEEWWKSRK